ncbi:retinol dehydrogenase 8 [Alosa sapidissima]|uniref:retinol dehydrogenase 8 n=1 Tax=Alosa sapidissima TaxID=34773 RepID=UPI001C0A630A|nr:retinol dehydrogenase 8 [Alosa sapidissima]XP_041941476.1 retinol dehydrogenase 8 [Alosa sapidissima]XP_041941477.1 retinol dehydrogenase 8 [Alosa sapidissima]XP_041941478.1 retinol dehydrogenase 8 [Alosa sapidissima]XP_041941479.1 retinol dehydrogenase 8 [Alosa sapidissima]
MGTRRVLVTGCSSGIGLAVAVRLAKDDLKRFKVVATMRNLERRQALERAAGETLDHTLEIRQLDACSEDSIRECVNSLPDRRVDVLVNNAGVGMIGPLECQSVGSMQELFNTNFFGLARLVKEVLPDMKRRQSGHIVVMSSVMGIQGLLFNDVYSASKFAVEGFCESLAVQAMKFNIKMTLVEPGPVVTEFERKVYEDAADMDLSGTDEETAKIFKQIYLPYSRKVFTSLGQTPEEVAEQTFQLIVSRDPPFRHQTNRLYMPLTAMKHADPTGRLPIDTFYKLVFKHDRVFNASLSLMKLMTKRTGKSGG